MREATERPRGRGAPLVQTSDHQPKVGHGNPWPPTKVITIDGRVGPSRRRGLEEFARLVLPCGTAGRSPSR